MSRQEVNRATAINKDFENIVSDSARAVSSYIKQVDLVKVFTVFMHHNILNNLGDMSLADRTDFRSALTPQYPAVITATGELTKLFNLYNEDPAVWQSNFDAYLVENPSILEEAINRYPKVS